MKMNWKARGTRHAALPPTNLIDVTKRSIEGYSVQRLSLREPIGHPVGERKPSDVHNHFDDYQLASPARLRSFALPHRS